MGTTCRSATLISTLMFSSIDLFDLENCSIIKFGEKSADSSKSLDEKKDSKFLLSNHKLFRGINMKRGEC